MKNCHEGEPQQKACAMCLMEGVISYVGWEMHKKRPVNSYRPLVGTWCRKQGLGLFQFFNRRFHACAVIGVYFATVFNVTLFDEIQGIAQSAGGVVKQDLLLLGRHQFKQGARL